MGPIDVLVSWRPNLLDKCGIRAFDNRAFEFRSHGLILDLFVSAAHD